MGNFIVLNAVRKHPSNEVPTYGPDVIDAVVTEPLGCKVNSIETLLGMVPLSLCSFI